MAEGGYTPREIDKFTLGEVNLLFEYWNRNPSVRALLAGFMGVKPKMKPKLRNASGGAPVASSSGLDVEALLREFPDGIIR